jgi:hypothetical protein
VPEAVLANLQKMAPARRFSPSGPRFTPAPSVYESVNVLVITAGLAIEAAAPGTEQAPHGPRSGSRTSLLASSISKEDVHRGQPWRVNAHPLSPWVADVAAAHSNSVARSGLWGVRFKLA